MTQSEYIAAIAEQLPHLEAHAQGLLHDTQQCQGRVFLLGNGGSATLASHMATDLQLAGVQAIPLTDVAAITTYANDFGYADSLFRYLMSHYVNSDDVVIGISTSGNSVNVLRALQHAIGSGAKVWALAGCGGGNMGNLKQPFNSLFLPTTHTGVTQDLQQILLHLVCYQLMNEKKGRV